MWVWCCAESVCPEHDACQQMLPEGTLWALGGVEIGGESPWKQPWSCCTLWYSCRPRGAVRS